MTKARHVLRSKMPSDEAVEAALSVAHDISRYKFTIPRNLDETRKHYVFCDIIAHPQLTHIHLAEIVKKSSKGMAVIGDVLRHRCRTPQIVSAAIRKIDSTYQISYALEFNQMSSDDLAYLWQLHAKLERNTWKEGFDLTNSSDPIDILFAKQAADLPWDAFWSLLRSQSPKVVGAFYSRNDICLSKVGISDDIALAIIKLKALADKNGLDKSLKRKLIEITK